MPNDIIQASFNSGEWSPKLFARVDLAKYKSGAALLENFFVDYRGGASTRPGTKYILQCRYPTLNVRLIPFQASFDIGYVLEFGHGYIRFFFNGAPVLEAPVSITNATQANPCVITVPGHTYVVGDWIFVSNVGGMTQLNGRYFIILAVSGNDLTLGAILNNANIDSTAYTAYTSGGSTERVYVLPAPYSHLDLRGIKFAQNVSQMILCHPSYVPYVLTLISPTNWTILPIVFGTTAAVPGGVSANTTLAAGSVNYAYCVTAVDGNGEESTQSATATLTNLQDLRTTAGSNSLSWSAATGAVAYNVYKTDVSYFGTVPIGATFGYIGTTEALTFIDSNIAPDFTQTPPIAKNPFIGQGVSSVAVTAPGTYTLVPSVSFTGAASTIAASATATLTVQTAAVAAGGAGYAVGDVVTFTNGVILIVATEAAGVVTAWTISSAGTVVSGSTPANPVVQLSTNGAGTGATATLTWGVGFVTVTGPGSGYTSTPTVTFSAGAATATAVVSSTAAGNPSVPGFFQQRLILAATPVAPQTFYMSQPGAYFNFNVSQVTLAHIEHPNGETRITTSSAEGVKCERCWNYTTDVGQDARFSTVCLRCAEALDAIGYPPYTASSPTTE